MGVRGVEGVSGGREEGTGAGGERETTGRRGVKDSKLALRSSLARREIAARCFPSALLCWETTLLNISREGVVRVGLGEAIGEEKEEIARETSACEEVKARSVLVSPVGAGGHRT